MKYTSLKGLVVGAMLASSLFAAAPALAANTDASVVTVTGYAQQEVAPDTAYVTIGTTSTDADAQQARTKNNLAMNEVTNALKAMGIPAENLKTTGFYMSPNYDVKGSKITSYTVTNNLEVKLTDLSMVSQVINKAASLGANQVNNVLCFPGLFKGALSVRARDINDQMKLAAAYAIADLITDADRSEENIIPGAFDPRVAEAVAAAVAKAARETGVARL